VTYQGKWKLQQNIISHPLTKRVIIKTRKVRRREKDTQYEKCYHKEYIKQNKADQVAVGSKSKNRYRPFKKKINNYCLCKKWKHKNEPTFQKTFAKYIHRCPASYINKIKILQSTWQDHSQSAFH